LLLRGELAEAESSAFVAFARFADWLWATTHATSGLSPEALVDALFNYMTEVRLLPVDEVRAALLADYVASGARSNPMALQGHLPVRAAPAKSGQGTLVARQAMHLLAKPAAL
jgi:hypothetical protein